MPYNVVGLRGARSEIAFCRNAAEAREVSGLWLKAGVRDVRVVSTEGAKVAPEGLEAIARAERAICGPAASRGLIEPRWS